MPIVNMRSFWYRSHALAKCSKREAAARVAEREDGGEDQRKDEEQRDDRERRRDERVRAPSAAWQCWPRS